MSRCIRTHKILAYAIMIASPLWSQILENSSVEEFIQEALKNNPEVLALRKNMAAAKARIAYTGTLPDPMLKLGLMNLPVNSFDFDQEPMTGKQIMLTQRLPFSGILGLKSEAARQMANIAEAQLRAKENEVVRKVKEAIFNLEYLKQALDLAQKNQDILDQFVRIATQKYEVGKGLQQNVLRAQVALSKMTEKVIILQQEERSVKVELNTLLGRAVDHPLMIPMATPVPISVSVEEDTLFTIAEEHNPMLTIKEGRIAVRSAQRRLATRSYFPHFDLSVAYTQRENIMGTTMHDFFSAQVGFSLPLWFWRNQKNRTQEAQLRLEESLADYENTRSVVHQKVADLVILLEERAKRIQLYRDGILPQGRQSLDAAISAYTVNRVDFLTLLDTQKQYFDDEMAYARLAADHEITKAKLEEAVGKKLFSLFTQKK